MPNAQWKKIADALRAQIHGGVLQPGDRLPSEVEIATQWGVSRPTAHRAVGELQRQGYVTRQRRWGTVVAPSSARRAGLVALVFDHFAHAYGFPQTDLIRGVQDGLGDEFNMLWCDSKDDPDREADILRRMQEEADGVLLYPISAARNTPLLRRMVEAGKPLVLLDRVPQGCDAHAVVTDNEEAAARAVRVLVDRGHRRIAFLAFHKPDVSTVGERYAGYLRALRECGLDDGAASGHVRWFSRDLEHQPDLLRPAMHDTVFALARGENPATAVFCTQDILAECVLEARESLSLQSFELATYNDWPPMLLRSPWNAHRVVQRFYDIGRSSSERLKLLIQGEDPSPRLLRIPADLFIADAGLAPPAEGNTLTQTNGG